MMVAKGKGPKFVKMPKNHQNMAKNGVFGPKTGQKMHFLVFKILRY